MAKEFTYKGKSLEELKKMSIQEFAKLLPARQRRSVSRGFTDAQKRLIKKVENAGNKKKMIKTHCRDIIILPSMVGLTIHVHNGKIFHPIMIMPEMIGLYLGEMSLTRTKVQHSAPGIGATRSSTAIATKK